MLKPLGKRVIIKVAEAEEKSAGGLVLPSSAKEKQQIGEILAVGSGVDAEAGVKVGDTVIFKAFTGTEVTDLGETFLIIEFDDLLAVLA